MRTTQRKERARFATFTYIANLRTIVRFFTGSAKNNIIRWNHNEPKSDINVANFFASGIYTAWIIPYAREGIVWFPEKVSNIAN